MEGLDGDYILQDSSCLIIDGKQLFFVDRVMNLRQTPPPTFRLSALYRLLLDRGEFISCSIAIHSKSL